MRHHARVGAKDHLYASFVCFTEIVALNLRNLAVLAQIVLQNAVFRAFGLGIVGVEDIHREPHRTHARGGKLYAFIVDKACMLNRVDARLDRGLNAVSTMRMCRNAQAPLMRLIGNYA